MSDVVIELTTAEHRELLALLLHYSTRTDHWAVSQGLRSAVVTPTDDAELDWLTAAKAVERGEAPSGSVVFKLTGRNSVTTPGLDENE